LVFSSLIVRNAVQMSTYGHIIEQSIAKTTIDAMEMELVRKLPLALPKIKITLQFSAQNLYSLVFAIG